jgi:hypothetical protein
MAIVLGMTERNHKKEGTIDHLLAHLLPADLALARITFSLLSVSEASVLLLLSSPLTLKLL